MVLAAWNEDQLCLMDFLFLVICEWTILVYPQNIKKKLLQRKQASTPQIRHNDGSISTYFQVKPHVLHIHRIDTIRRAVYQLQQKAPGHYLHFTSNTCQSERMRLGANTTRKSNPLCLQDTDSSSQCSGVRQQRRNAANVCSGLFCYILPTYLNFWRIPFTTDSPCSGFSETFKKKLNISTPAVAGLDKASSAACFRICCDVSEQTRRA